MSSKKLVSDSLRMFRQSVRAVLPDQLMRISVQYDATLNRLLVAGEAFPLHNKRVHLVGAGKAVQRMARELERVLGDVVSSGIVSVPAGSLDGPPRGIVQYYEGAKDNLPDADAMRTSIMIKDFVSKLDDDDILIVLISGGGSALLTLPSPPITLLEKLNLIKKLTNSGADIKELNTVRKKLSELKGGRLAALAAPAQVLSLILSDIVGDPIDLIASGPTVLNEDPPSKAKDVVDKYKLFDGLPECIQQVLLRDSKEAAPNGVRNFIIGSNRVSLDAALNEATTLSYPALVVSSEVTGNISDVASTYVSLVKCLANVHYGRISGPESEDILKSLNIRYSEHFIANIRNIVVENRLCLILGGETTVHVRGTGKGGRNQQLALELSKQLHDGAGSLHGVSVHVLCAGTDGMDGPTDAAGALGYSGLLHDARRSNLNVEQYLADNDSYTFYSLFKGGSLHVKTGHTHTNVMDVHIIILSFE